MNPHKRINYDNTFEEIAKKSQPNGHKIVDFLPINK